MANAIELKDIKKGFAGVQALKGVSFAIKKGSVHALIGENGAGKSTLMNLLGCLDFPSQGEYLLNGESVTDLSDRQLSHIRNRQIGFVFQSFHLIPSLNALENVELPLLYRGVSRSRRRDLAARALEQVGLAQRMRHRPSQLSGGQRQRVAIARAIAGEPPILLADEPTGNLDSASGRQIMDILINLWRQGRTLILITHDPDVARAAPRIICIQDGSITQDSLSSS